MSIIQTSGLLTPGEQAAYAITLILRWEHQPERGLLDAIEQAEALNNSEDYLEEDREWARDYINDEIGDWL